MSDAQQMLDAFGSYQTWYRQDYLSWQKEMGDIDAWPAEPLDCTPASMADVLELEHQVGPMPGSWKTLITQLGPGFVALAQPIGEAPYVVELLAPREIPAALDNFRNWLKGRPMLHEAVPFMRQDADYGLLERVGPDLEGASRWFHDTPTEQGESQPFARFWIETLEGCIRDASPWAGGDQPPSTKVPNTLIDVLLESGAIELEEGTDRGVMAAALEQAFPGRIAHQRLVSWLLARDELVELYASDDDLKRIIKAW